MERDQELICLYKSGDESALEELIEMYQNRLFSFFLRLGSACEEAEDMVQETFIKIIRSISTYEPKEKFSSYLYKVAKNCWYDYVRKKQRDKSVSIESDGINFVEGASVSKENSPQANAAMKEVNEIILIEIDKLPEEQRMAVILSEIENLKYREIAEILEIPIGTVKSRIHNAYERLRENLSPLLKSEVA
ncbi:MAG: RNA polymerase sigma factor [Planctomycetota bacterium]|jgi:RNA polymerase sigma-70 factor (ECF subfamily)